MGRWTPTPIVGGAYSDDTKPWTVQDTVNYIPVIAERPGGRSDSQLRDAPGLRPYVDIGNGPIRGLHDVEGMLLAVSGNRLYRITNRQVAVPLGTIPGVSRVSMAHNQITGGSEVVIATGDGGYVYNTVEETLEPITDDGFPGLRVVDFVDGYIAGVEPGGRYWLHSSLADAHSWNELDRSDSEAQPDKIVSLIVDHREVWVLNKRTIEPFENTGAETGTFQRVSGTVIEVGCDGRYAVCKMDNSVIWVGGGIVYRANGYSPVRISTHAIEQALSRCDLSRAYMFTYEDRGHKIAYLTCPDGYTWGYDAATNEWHRRESYGMNRWRLSALVKSGNNWVGGDFANGKLYLLDWNYKVEGDTYEQPLVRRRVSGVLHDNQNPVWLNAVELVLDTGGDTTELASFPIQPDPPVLTGDAPGGVIGASYSFSYSASDGLAPYKYRVVSGTLPPGLALNQNTGALTGTPTTAGTYTFRVRATDYNGLYDEVNDSIAIGVEWWAIETDGENASKVWISTDPTNWAVASYTRAPFLSAPTFGALDTGGPSAIVGGETSDTEYIVDLDPTSGITTTVVTSAADLIRWRYINGVVFGFAGQDSGNHYYTSEDHGASFDEQTVDNSRQIHDVAWLEPQADFPTGRWISFRELSTHENFVYSDEVGAPTTWALGLVSPAGGPFARPVACNGSVAIWQSNNNDFYRTSDGIDYDRLQPSLGILVACNDAIAIGDVFMFVSQTGQLIRTPDAGTTWAVSTLDIDNIHRIHYANGCVVASGATNVSGDKEAIAVSTDLGETWQYVTPPEAITSGDSWAVCPVSRV
jgi:hypothetical protein